MILDSSVLSQSFNEDDKNCANSDNSFNNQNESVKLNSLLSAGNDIDRSIGSGGSGKNSLAQLCRRFLMVLLCNPVCVYNFFFLCKFN